MTLQRVIASNVKRLTVNHNCKNQITMMSTLINHTSNDGMIRANTERLNLHKKDHHYQKKILREFGRKAARMGHHLQNLEEMAHDQERQKAKQQRIKKKKQRNNPEMTTIQANDGDDYIDDIDDFDDGMDFTSSDEEHLPDVVEVEGKMMRLVDRMEESFKSIRGGEPTPEMFDSIQVEAYGTYTPLKSVGQVVIVSPTMATITCFDPSNAVAVRDAVRDNMELNPSVENGSEVKVPLPKVSVETRQALVKQLSKTAESTRQKVRNIRRRAQSIIKPAKDGNMEGVSKDDAFRVSKQIDSSTEQVISSLNAIVEHKKSSILSI